MPGPNGPANSFTPWQGGGDPNGLLGPSPVFRDAKDRLMSQFGVGPDTQYPDGYLGTQAATSRRSDKLLDSVHRTNTRPYSRGVHKGERINPGDYVWPKEFNPETALRYEAQGKKWAPSGEAAQVLVNDGKAGPVTGINRTQMEVVDQQRQSMLRSLAPDWR